MNLKPRWKNWYKFILCMLAYPGIIISVAMIATWYLNLESTYIKLGSLFMYHLAFWSIIGGITMIFEEVYHRFCE